MTDAISEVAAICIERNVRDATWVHDQIIAGKDREIELLQEQLRAYWERDSRMRERLDWLLGYGEDDFFIDRR